MSGTRNLVAVFTALTAFGCGSRDVAGPPAVTTTRSINLASPNTVFGAAGSELKAPFSVKVVTYPGSQPVAGVVVTFVVAAHPTPAFSAVTNADGVATLASIHLDVTPGRYDVAATVEGTLSSAAFTMIAFSQAPTAVYDLKAEGGEPVTGTYPGPKDFPTLTGGHYVLFGDGSYVTIYEVNLVSNVSGAYKFAQQDPQTVNFYEVPAATPEFTPDPAYLYSVGTLSGDTMAVTYQDNIDYPDEVYVLRK